MVHTVFRRRKFDVLTSRTIVHWTSGPGVHYTLLHWANVLLVLWFLWASIEVLLRFLPLPGGGTDTLV